MLTDEQMEAVLTKHDKCVIAAGAGTGKTTTLVHRCRQLLLEGAAPEEIMVVTFTRKAAQELEERLGDAGKMMKIGTFHALLIRAINKSGKHLTPLDEDAADSVLDSCAASIGVAYKVNGKYTYEKKNRRHWKKQIEACRRSGEHEKCPIATAYFSALALSGSIDYDGILYEGLEMLKKESHPLSTVKHLIVDEAQDNSRVQWDIVKEIGKYATVMCVGDAGQAIYSWRGAKPDLFRKLHWPRLKLTKTFRCCKGIVEFCNRNPQIEVELVSEKEDQCQAIDIRKDVDIVDVVADLEELGWKLEDIAILCRYNETVREIREKLQENLIGVAEEKFVPKGPVSRLMQWIADPTNSVNRRMAYLAVKPFLNDVKGKPIQWLISSTPTSSVATLVKTWVEGLGVRVGVKEVCEELSFGHQLSLEAQAISKLYEGETLEYYLIEEAISRPSSYRTSGISLMTIHAAKGLEWPVVVVPSLEKGNWPRGKAGDEDFRLFHVAVTRAETSAILIHNGTPGKLLEHFMEN